MNRWDEAFTTPTQTQPSPTVVTPIEPARATRYAHKALEAEVHAVAQAPEGQRNHTLNTAAYSLAQLVAAGHLEHQAVVDNLTNAARAVGLTSTETQATIESGMRAGALAPRIVPEPTEHDIPAVTVLDLTATQETDFWHARPILTHLHTFARARMVSPWAVLGCALARIITATPTEVCLPPIVGGKASLNMFIGLVGPSGSGKGAAEAVAAEAITLGYITTHNVGSGEGIAHGYMHRSKGVLEWNDNTHAVLFSVPEIDSLAAQGDRKGATLMPQLRSGWTGEQLGFGYADPAKRIIVPAHEYRLCLVAGIQPGRAGCLLDDSDGGTPQRFLWLPATDADAPDTEPDAPTPISWSAPSTSSIVSIGGAMIQVCDQAANTIKEARRARNRGDGDALDGHALLAQLKTAAALGILDGRYTVTDDDWNLAATIAAKSAATRAHVAETLKAKARAANLDRADAEATRTVHVNESVAAAALKRVSRIVTRKLHRSDQPLSARELRAATTSADRGYVDAAIEGLIDLGQVVAEHTDRTTKYRLAEGIE